ncbi:response regulator transcription factor [Pseudonocardia sp. NPDC049635]|uniref:response regulator transcription factor n=1 Tax=Pseudonocardia sp. NPDC049635 TaxID=3155506 RepID=UPI0033F5006B
MSTRVLVADDHPLIVTGISTVLGRDPGFEVVGTGHSGRETVRAVEELCPDVVLLDVRLGDMDGAQVARILLDARPGLRIVMLTAFDDPGVLQTCLAIGVSGILLKGSPDLDLAGALREVVRGGVVIDDSVAAALERASSLLDAGPPVGVRPREMEVLRLMAMGLTTRDVATELHLSVNTVRSYTQSLMEKLGAHTRVQAIVQARRLQLI